MFFMKIRLYNILILFVVASLFSIAINRECVNFDELRLEVEESYTSLFFYLDDNDNPYDYDVLDDYFVVKSQVHQKQIKNILSAPTMSLGLLIRGRDILDLPFVDNVLRWCIVRRVRGPTYCS